MNPNYEKLLETEIDRELKSLPELQAPAGMVNRVFQAIDSRARLPWFRQAWPAWPPVLRFTALGFLLAMFGGLCFAGWQVAQLESVNSSLKQVGNWFASIGAVGNALHVVISTLGLALKQLGTGFLIACLVIIAGGYAMFLGLGTVCFRLAYARR